LAKLVPPEQKTASTEPWQNQLSEILGGHRPVGVKVVLVGVGHPQRSDDYVGSCVVKRVIDAIHSATLGDTYLIDAEDNVEALISKIHAIRAKHVIFIDACQMRLKPGTVNLLAIEETSYPFFTTHGIPLKLLAEKLLRESKVWILAIQPKTTDFGETLSKELNETAVAISNVITASLEAS
jgi:hydrogenase maturation protease